MEWILRMEIFTVNEITLKFTVEIQTTKETVKLHNIQRHPSRRRIKNDVCFQTKMFYVFLFVLFFPNCCDNLKKLRIMWAIITFYCLYFFAVWHWMIVIYLLNDNKFKIILPFKLLTVLWCFMIEWEIGHSLDHI
jgi:hypothetical protein